MKSKTLKRCSKGYRKCIYTERCVKVVKRTKGTRRRRCKKDFRRCPDDSCQQAFY